MIKGIALGVLVLMALVAVTWVVQGNDFFLYKTFAPKYEQVRHDTFKQSQAYNDGMANELYKMRSEYASAKDDQTRDAIADMILHRASQYDTTRLPRDLQAFIIKLRNN